MQRACSRCGKIHSYNYNCKHNKVYSITDTEEHKLRSANKWTQKSLEIRERANNLCELCRLQNRYVYDGVEVHHITPIRENKALWLDNNNLICLCVAHHKQADAGLLDNELLRELARAREEK